MSGRARQPGTSKAAYAAAQPRARSGYNRDLDIVDEWDRHPERSLTSILKSHHRSPAAFKRNVPVRKIGRRLALASPGRRRLYRGPVPMLAKIDGQVRAIQVVPTNDAQRRAIEAHDRAVFAAVTGDDDSDLGKFRSRTVTDAETGQRYRFATDGTAIREAADSGEVELEDLWYSGHTRHDLDSLSAGMSA